MTTSITAGFRQLISLHMGLVIPDKDEANLEKLLASRAKSLNLPSTSDYYSFLAEDRPGSEQEWKRLAHHLTIGESYFFRDVGQMHLLEKVLIPEILKRKADDPFLRILSAGCATGEEPYSIAMMLDRLLSSLLIPQYSHWQIHGVDINEEALNLARTGKYGAWSFRGVPQEIQDAYFKPLNRQWLLDKRIRDQVTFHHLNLVKDSLANDRMDLRSMDVVLCRNVNIYFKKETVSLILDKLVNTMRPGGYLITGHGELQGITHPLLTMHSHPESVVYQRKFDQKAPSSVSWLSSFNPIPSITLLQPKEPPASHRPVVPVLDSPIFTVQQNIPDEPVVLDTTHEVPHSLFRDGHYQKVISHTKSIIEKNANHLESWRLMARAHANLGEHNEADACCDEMIKIDAFYAHAYYLKAHLAMERGEDAKTKEFLKRALYLDHTFIAPHLELADIHEREGNAVMARKMRMAALQLLRSLPADAELDMMDEYTAGELLQDIEKLV